jgi:hypothetical protein
LDQSASRRGDRARRSYRTFRHGTAGEERCDLNAYRVKLGSLDGRSHPMPCAEGELRRKRSSGSPDCDATQSLARSADARNRACSGQCPQWSEPRGNRSSRCIVGTFFNPATVLECDRLTPLQRFACRRVNIATDDRTHAEGSVWPIGDGGGGNSSLEMTTARAQIIESDDFDKRS